MKENLNSKDDPVNWKPITLEELKGLGRRIDAEFVFAPSESELHLKLNTEYGHEQWAILRAPVWCGDQLVAFVVKPRVE